MSAPTNPTPSTSSQPIIIPPGYTLHTESSTHILLSPTDAFLNPAQQFNRDLSVAIIRGWSEMWDEEKRERWAGKRKRKQEAGKGGGGGKNKRRKVGGAQEAEAADGEDMDMTDPPAEEPAEAAPAEPGASSTAPPAPTSSEPTYRPHRFTLLEAFAATGLRSIRYAKELPLLKYVVANDLSSQAVEAVRRNAELNGLVVADAHGKVQGSSSEEQKAEGEGEVPPAPAADAELVNRAEPNAPSHPPPPAHPKIRLLQSDARLTLYAHTPLPLRYDCVDLDPYGTASPFLDGAVQALSDNGLLCVTCTDMGVLASTNYSEKCFANYGGVPVKAEYSHEAALRLVLHAIQTSAARYGRTIEPLLSLSIDFYVRLFLRIRTSPLAAKESASRTGTVYVCSGCQAWHVQPLGRHVKEGKGNPFKLSQGPPRSLGQTCAECGSKHHLAGPMWIGPLHNRQFVQRVLKHVSEEGEEKYGTWQRMKGMLSIAAQELDVPFYFTPGSLAGLFHCVCPSLQDVVSALLNAGWECSRSHAVAGSVKTDAGRGEVYDLMRTWIRGHPVNAGKVKEGSPAAQLLAKELKKEADFTPHPGFHERFSGIKLVRYTAEKWAPGTRAKG